MLLAGTARTSISPFPGVELTGWGYYLNRIWRDVHDDINATAIAVEGSDNTVILISLDLMVIDERFTNQTRHQISDATGLPTHSILLTCSHTHNAPAAGGLLGVGKCCPLYEDWAADRTAATAIEAWNNRQPVSIRCGTNSLHGISFNRTRTKGVVDTTLTAALLEAEGGQPLAVIVNYGAHPTVATELRPFHVSRDAPGHVCDLLEQKYRGATAVYVQGACGDVNFLRDFQTPDRWTEPAFRIAESAVTTLLASKPSTDDRVIACHRNAVLPTRRWTMAEIEADQIEAARRLEMQDFRNWRDTIGRSMTNRPDDMVARHGGDEEKAVRAMCRFHREWTTLMLEDVHSRSETLTTEVQSIRIGPLNIVANSAELFSPFAMAVRQGSPFQHNMIACYSNGRIGYLPDAHDINAKSYAGYQSPKYCNQFPFTADSGPAMVTAMLEVIRECA